MARANASDDLPSSGTEEVIWMTLSWASGSDNCREILSELSASMNAEDFFSSKRSYGLVPDGRPGSIPMV